MPCVSVIIPNYNHASYLPKRIESVLNQTYQDFEVILMDDCSTDNSCEIILEYAKKDGRIKVLFNEQNSGSTFKQWNKGIKESKGEFVWLAESDDFADVDFLTDMVVMLINRNTASLAYCQSWNIDENDNIHGDWKIHTDLLDIVKWQTSFIEKGEAFIKKYMLFINPIPNASAVLLRKSHLQKVNYANTSYKLNGDWELWIKMLLNSELIFVNKKLNYFRSHSSNVRSKYIKNGLNIEETCRLIILALSKLKLEGAIKHRVALNIQNLWSQQKKKIPLSRNLKIVYLVTKINLRVAYQMVKKIII